MVACTGCDYRSRPLTMRRAARRIGCARAAGHDHHAGEVLIPAGIIAATSGRAIEDLPAFCEVHGILKPTDVSVIHFEVWLPASNWNGRLEGVGNGGLAGTISFGPMATALRNRFATASTDTGHTAEEPRVWLQNSERLIDYSCFTAALPPDHRHRVLTITATTERRLSIPTISAVPPAGSRA